VEQIFRRLGQRIRDVRVQRGFASQEAFADYLKVHRTFVGHLETGRKDFRLTTLIRIAEALEVPLADLFTGLEADKPLKLNRRTGVGGRTAILRELNAVEQGIQRMKALVSPPPDKWEAPIRSSQSMARRPEAFLERDIGETPVEELRAFEVGVVAANFVASVNIVASQA
jgi:transcriptional regulator with XRE-family HTH domain